jgi:hypothetical protein
MGFDVDGWGWQLNHQARASRNPTLFLETIPARKNTVGEDAVPPEHARNCCFETVGTPGQVDKNRQK